MVLLLAGQQRAEGRVPARETQTGRDTKHDTAALLDCGATSATAIDRPRGPEGGGSVVLEAYC
jgi:hypothetical protein